MQVGFKAIYKEGYASVTNILLVAGVIGFLYITLTYGIIAGAAFCALPFILFFAIILMDKPKVYALVIYIATYFLTRLSYYSESFKSGIIFDAMIGSLMAIILFQTMLYKNIKLRYSINLFSVLSFFWLLYCFLLLFNTRGATIDIWYQSVRWIAMYMFFMALIVPLIVTDVKAIRTLLFTLAILTLIGVGKAVWQKYIGFDSIEKYQLYVLGKARTHIIYSGIRYFSIFTDAANFGTSMGMSFVVYISALLYEKRRSLRLFYVGVALLSFVGLLFSGTRSAMAVPVIGLVVMIGLSKRIKIMTVGGLAMVVAIAVLKFTTVGNGNQYIRRMRTIFAASEDASYLVRKKNQKVIYKYLADKPFGVGVGVVGPNAILLHPHGPISYIATDSQYVRLRIETGIVGLTLFLSVMLILVLYGCYITMFKIKDPYLRGVNAMIVGVLCGMIGDAWANEILLQFPNGVIVFTFVAVMCSTPRMDKELQKGGVESKSIGESVGSSVSSGNVGDSSIVGNSISINKTV